jgi:hypothetical protein
LYQRIKRFSYTGSAEEDVKTDLGGRAFFIQLCGIWKAREIPVAAKLRIFRSNLESVLVCGWETWKVTQSIGKELQTFINKCLKKICNTFWHKAIRN